MVKIINDKTDITTIISDASTSVIDCYAEWCGPCKQLATALDALDRKYPDVKVYKVDVDKHDIEHIDVDGKKVPITSLPTVLVTRAGKLLDVVVGVKVADIERAIQKDL